MAAASTTSENQGKAKQHVTGARFRQRKISVKQPLTIYKQRDLPTPDSNELEPSQVHHLNSNASSSSTQQPRDLHAVETGVDKNEEEEVHLQQVINAAQKALWVRKEEKAVICIFPHRTLRGYGPRHTSITRIKSSSSQRHISSLVRQWRTQWCGVQYGRGR